MAYCIQWVDQVAIHGGLVETLYGSELSVFALHRLLPLLLHEFIDFRGDPGLDFGVTLARRSAQEHPKPLTEATDGGRETV